MTDVWTYDRFEENASLGECTVSPDMRQLELWHSIEGRATGQSDTRIGLPSGLLVALAMRGYLTIVAPRPPGNVHGTTVLRWGTVKVSVGDPLRVRVTCLTKKFARERRWVNLLVSLVDRDDALILSNELKMLWAA